MRFPEWGEEKEGGGGRGGGGKICAVRCSWNEDNK